LEMTLFVPSNIYFNSGKTSYFLKKVLYIFVDSLEIM
jgi:hypothetical protein